MSKKSSTKAYLGLPWLFSLILAIFPPTNIVLGIVTRILRGSILFAILNFFLCPIFYVIDLISIILNNDLKWLI